MKDTFGREITYLRLSVTDRCDLRCRYCMPEDGIRSKLRHEDILTEDEMIRAVEAAASLGIRKLRVTGGEPLVKKNILSICRRAAAVAGIEELCMTTNGCQLPAFAPALRAAGIQRLNISLDTLDAEKYRSITRCGELDNALRGIQAALDAGFDKIKLNAVLIGGLNDDEIVPLADLTRRWPVDVRFIELMPISNGGAIGPEAYVPGDAVLAALPEAMPLPADGGVAERYLLPGALGTVGIIPAVSRRFCDRCDRIRLTADGRLKPCLHGAQEFPIKGLSREEMAAQMRRAILAKPACHGPLSGGARSRAGRNMNEIGG